MRLALLFSVLFLAGCSASSSPDPSDGGRPPFLNANTAVDYVGAAACASCHEDQYAGFQEHGMANSFYELTPDNTVEALPGPWIVDRANGYRYRAERRGDVFLQVEELQDHSGQVIHTLEREMKYVMGSGTAARTYFDDSQGFLYELPLTWYTQKGRWDFSPGYEVANKRFDRKVPERCMACHNDYTKAEPFTGGKFADIPLGIGCERCHGPGALHVSQRLAVPEPLTEVDSTIVNPAHLDLDRRLDVCQQCHLHTTVSVLREGNQAFDFRPSHDLSAFVAMYSVPEPDMDTEIGVISHADRMKQSACFLETVAQGGSFECTTCHDPHEGFRASGPDYFNQTCLTCHAPPELALLPSHPDAESNCVDCHMPRVEASEAPHSSFTDHKIRVVSSREVAKEPIGNGRLESYWPENGRTAYEGMALVILGRQRADANLLGDGAALLDSLAREGHLHGEAHFLRGLARLELADPERALDGLGAATRLDGDIPERLNAFAQALEATDGDVAVIEEAYTRALAAQTARADIWVNYGRFLESRNRLEEAAAAYREAVEQEPWLAAASYNLGTAQARGGHLLEAVKTLQAAVKLEPRNPQAWGNLGAVYGQLQKPDSTRFAFEQAVLLAPDNAVALGNLGAFYVNTRQYQLAIPYLERAILAAPQFADALANRAVAHFQLGERASAALYARRALEAQPGHPVATQILTALN
ncbi:MAG: Tfp pilus assembly protein PilF [Rhodothermales bacterium]